MTKLYLTKNSPSFTPTNFRGSWDNTASAVTKALSFNKLNNDNITNISVTETSASNVKVLLFRGVTEPLQEASINDLTIINVVIGVIEKFTALIEDPPHDQADFNYYAHIYTTQGDSDSVRATLLDNFNDLGNEWGVTALGKSFSEGVPASPISALQYGDRIVFEIGYYAGNVSTNGFTGTIYYGTSVGGNPVGDLTVGGDGLSLAGYLDIGATLSPIEQISISVLLRRNINYRIGSRSIK